MKLWGDLGHSETGSGESVGRVLKKGASARAARKAETNRAAAGQPEAGESVERDGTTVRDRPPPRLPGHRRVATTTRTGGKHHRLPHRHHRRPTAPVCGNQRWS